MRHVTHSVGTDDLRYSYNAVNSFLGSGSRLVSMGASAGVRGGGVEIRSREFNLIFVRVIFRQIYLINFEMWKYCTVIGGRSPCERDRCKANEDTRVICSQINKKPSKYPASARRMDVPSAGCGK